MAKAVVVIDMQERYLEAIRNLQVKENLLRNTQTMLDNLNRGILPIFIQFVSKNYSKPSEKFPPEVAKYISSWEDIINKTCKDAFTNPDLENRLREEGINELFLCGLFSSQCVLETARSARRVGFKVYCARNTMADHELHLYPGTLERYNKIGAIITDSFSSSPFFKQNN
jgi:nicotinamidase-related amidase